MDTCIALRTMVIQPGDPGGIPVYVQAGAGIVADSVPAREYEETMQQGQGMLTAVEMAEERF